MVIGWLFFVFTEAGDGFITHRWCWRFLGPDGVSRTANQGFTTAIACWADAAKHGLTERDVVTIAARGSDKRLMRDPDVSAIAPCNGTARRPRASLLDKAYRGGSSARSRAVQVGR